MTEVVFNNKVRSALKAWVEKMVKQFNQDLKNLGEKETRRQWRETHGLTFTKRYIVPAHFRLYKKGLLSRDGDRTLDAQKKLR